MKCIYTIDVTFEWDEAKNSINIVKHGHRFEDAEVVFEDFYLEVEDTRQNYGEVRYLVLGLLKGQVVVICYTPRPKDTYRIISMRKANKYETNTYYQATS